AAGSSPVAPAMITYLLSFVGRFVLSAIAFSCAADVALQERDLIMALRGPISESREWQKD
ncbi:hypothetical protein, partial [Thalassospira sp.]|uniref:hypothetical protein n=1 Tax=Thalassospira sp. TaxID=1912094 RepID=UPI00257C4DBA